MNYYPWHVIKSLKLIKIKKMIFQCLKIMANHLICPENQGKWIKLG